jgi:hypothetical protein
MYTVDHRVRERRSKRPLIVTIILVTLLALAAAAWVYMDTRNSSEVTTSDQTPIVSKLTDDKDLKVFEGPGYTLELPSDWEPGAKVSNTVLDFVEFKMGKEPKDRKLTIYKDKLPGDLAMNKLLPVILNKNKLTPGLVSDNCSTFTGLDVKPGAPKQEKMPSKWQDVAFICDMGNVTRNVIGTGTAEHGIQVPLTGETSGTHTYFFLFNDQNTRADATVLIDAIKTFRVN